MGVIKPLLLLLPQPHLQQPHILALLDLVQIMDPAMKVALGPVVDVLAPLMEGQIMDLIQLMAPRIMDQVHMVPQAMVVVMVDMDPMGDLNQMMHTPRPHSKVMLKLLLMPMMKNLSLPT